MLVILPAELLPTSREANMFATKCGHMQDVRSRSSIRRELNAIEFSLLSRLPILLIDFEDRQVTEDVLKDSGSLWGPHTVACFATYYNRKIVRYFSRFWNPDTSGIDALMQSWKVENSWLVPPVSYSHSSCLYV